MPNVPPPLSPPRPLERISGTGVPSQDMRFFLRCMPCTLYYRLLTRPAQRPRAPHSLCINLPGGADTDRAHRGLHDSGARAALWGVDNTGREKRAEVAWGLPVCLAQSRLWSSCGRSLGSAGEEERASRVLDVRTIRLVPSRVSGRVMSLHAGVPCRLQWPGQASSSSLCPCQRA